jgi:hypothetical protein
MLRPVLAEVLSETSRIRILALVGSQLIDLLLEVGIVDGEHVRRQVETFSCG